MSNSKVHSLLSTKIIRINDELSRITWGGCGRAALSLHKALTAKNIPSDIVLVSYMYDTEDVDMMIRSMGADDINEAYMNMFEDMEYDDYPAESPCNGHICVRVDNQLYDTDGKYRGTAISDGITVATMELFLKMNECWNDAFENANAYDEFIDETFDHFFKELLTEV